MASTTKPSRKERREQEREDRFEARRQLALGQIRRYPDPALRERAREVEEFSDDLRALVARMGRVMEDAHGVGLAATQLGLLRRILVFRRRRGRRARRIVNPVDRRAVRGGGGRGRGLPLAARGPRARRAIRAIVVGASTPTAPRSGSRSTASQSRVIQHEIDHLDGVLIFDRTTPEARREAIRSLRPRPDQRGSPRLAARVRRHQRMGRRTRLTPARRRPRLESPSCSPAA